MWIFGGKGLSSLSYLTCSYTSQCYIMALDIQQTSRKFVALIDSFMKSAHSFYTENYPLQFSDIFTIVDAGDKIGGSLKAGLQFGEMPCKKQLDLCMTLATMVKDL